MTAFRARFAASRRIGQRVDSRLLIAIALLAAWLSWCAFARVALHETTTEARLEVVRRPSGTESRRRKSRAPLVGARPG